MLTPYPIGHCRYQVLDAHGRLVGWLDERDDYVALTPQGACIGIFKSRPSALGGISAYLNGQRHSPAATADVLAGMVV